MELSDAISLIEAGIDKSIRRQSWADLGAGDGLFTMSLASILTEGEIIAIDRNASVLAGISRGTDSVKVSTMQADFAAEPWQSEPLDGILLANALHFVSDQKKFMIGIKERLKPSGRVLIVEYERTIPSQWVPYPVSFSSLQLLANQVGFHDVKKLRERPSLYQGMMYSALLTL
jgi:ubiquinone/menaquinone biosynthesis C-methylase UbiE